jgi:ribose/xylose/arabinose/galactoside ABC-type transport system permease subunit
MGKKLLKCLGMLLVFFPAKLWAQNGDLQKQYTAFDMRANGKIYVVVTVLLIIVIGFILYLVRLDRKISRLEKENK